MFYEAAEDGLPNKNFIMVPLNCLTSGTVSPGRVRRPPEVRSEAERSISDRHNRCHRHRPTYPAPRPQFRPCRRRVQKTFRIPFPPCPGKVPAQKPESPEKP